MNSFEIKHRTGRIELYTDKFFPCSQKVAKLIFKLAKKNCLDYELKKLLEILVERERFLEMELIDLEERGDETLIKRKKREIDQIRANQMMFVKIIGI